MTDISNIKNWEELNKVSLAAELDFLRIKLEKYIRQNKENNENIFEQSDEGRIRNGKNFANSALNHLCNIFNLSAFEREILLLCAGVELDSRFPLLFAKVHSNSLKPYCTFSLALSVLNEPHWSALNPYAPLRRWKLIELETGQTITSGQLRIDERILHYLTGISYLDKRLEGVITCVTRIIELPPSNESLVQTINEILKQNNTTIIQLVGNDIQTNKTIAYEASVSLHLNLFTLKAVDIPADFSERLILARLWEREALLNNAVLFIDCEYSEDSNIIKALKSFLEETRTVIFLSSLDMIKTHEREIIYLNVKSISIEEQFDLWKKRLGKTSNRFNGQIEKAAFHFQLKACDIHSIAASLNEEDGLSNDEELKTKLWNFCRLQSRQNLENLVQRIESSFSWSDIVLPKFQLEILWQISIHLKESYKVYETWGFKRKGLRGLGISALFTGISGTGKTLAAEILANELQLDLYRIDLSSVVSKYIGETEKNLKRVFDTAEESGAILLFDEADALFGKRSEVKDSHDRYANIEVSYLLQRMELYRGLAILTTNFKNLLDTAFLRRIRFIINFPFPDFNQRADIWRNIFPKETPIDKLDFAKLAKLNVNGGNIRNIALNAAFIAANDNETVKMRHILFAAKKECTKLEKPLTDAEIEGWI